jgi:hypothetical protein
MHNNNNARTEGPGVTFHVVKRYQERVDDSLDNAAARAEVKRIIATGHRMGPGRGRWGHVRLAPGCLLVEDPLDPNVALIEGDGVVKTVMIMRPRGAAQTKGGGGYEWR